MKKIIKKTVCLLLASSLVLLASCTAGGDTADIPEYSSDKSFRFAAYMPPPQENVGADLLKNNPSYITDDNYKGIADCGFDYVYAVYENKYSDVVKALEYSENHGLKYVVRDSALQNYMGRNAPPITELTQEQKDQLTERFAWYSSYDSFAGHFAVDEPNTDVFGNIRVLKDFYNEAMPGKEFLINLHPISLGGENSASFGSATYTEYASSFMETVEPDMISYDKYPLYKDSGGNPEIISNYFRNIELFADHAKELNIPLHVFLLTMGHHRYRTPENYSDIAFQVYTNMAFGAQGAATFTYWTTMSAGENITHGLVDWYGNKMQSWYSMQEVIAEVRAMEDAYMNFKWENTIAYLADEDYPNYQYETMKTSVMADETTQNPHSAIKKLKGAEDFLLGAFKDSDGRDGFMLANATDPGYKLSNEIEISFKDASKVLVYKKGRSVVYNLKKGVYKTVVGAGEGEFIIPIK